MMVNMFVRFSQCKRTKGKRVCMCMHEKSREFPIPNVFGAVEHCTARK